MISLRQKFLFSIKDIHERINTRAGINRWKSVGARAGALLQAQLMQRITPFPVKKKVYVVSNPMYESYSRWDNNPDPVEDMQKCYSSMKPSIGRVRDLAKQLVNYEKATRTAENVMNAFASIFSETYENIEYNSRVFECLGRSCQGNRTCSWYWRDKNPLQPPVIWPFLNILYLIIQFHRKLWNFWSGKNFKKL